MGLAGRVGGLAGRLVGMALLVAPALGHAACEPGVEGLVVAAADGRLEVAATAPNSPAALGGVAVGDVVVQVNAARPATCEAWRAVVEAASRADVDLLVMVQQRGRRRVVAVATGSAVAAPARSARAAAAAPAPDEVASAPAAPAAAEPTPRRRRVPPAGLLPDAVPVTRSDVIALIGEIGPEGRGERTEYEDAVTELRRALSTLLVRDPGTEDADVLLRIVRLHEGAVIAWDAVEAIRRRQGLRTTVPVSVGATESYFSGSRVASLIADVPALERAVRMAPGHGRIELAGLWEPMRARGLLWAEADKLFAELVGDGRRD
jgi:hypothetical protein